METLLTTPIKPLEVILGKIIPHLLLGYTLFFLIIILSYYFYNVPFNGSLLLLTIVTLPYLFSSLSVGLAVSSVSRTLLRAANLANVYVLPAILLSGFLFPFYAMPDWAQWVGELLPPTHYLRIAIAIMLKGSGLDSIWPNLWPILIFDVIIIYISFRNYRVTLD